MMLETEEYDSVTFGRTVTPHIQHGVEFKELMLDTLNHVQLNFILRNAHYKLLHIKK